MLGKYVSSYNTAGDLSNLASPPKTSDRRTQTMLVFKTIWVEMLNWGRQAMGGRVCVYAGLKGRCMCTHWKWFCGYFMLVQGGNSASGEEELD